MCVVAGDEQCNVVRSSQADNKNIVMRGHKQVKVSNF